MLQVELYCVYFLPVFENGRKLENVIFGVVDFALSGMERKYGIVGNTT
jgi:hypothetical protein